MHSSAVVVWDKRRYGAEYNLCILEVICNNNWMKESDSGEYRGRAIFSRRRSDFPLHSNS